MDMLHDYIVLICPSLAYIQWTYNAYICANSFDLTWTNPLCYKYSETLVDLCLE